MPPLVTHMVAARRAAAQVAGTGTGPGPGPGPGPGGPTGAHTCWAPRHQTSVC